MKAWSLRVEIVLDVLLLKIIVYLRPCYDVKKSEFFLGLDNLKPNDRRLI